MIDVGGPSMLRAAAKNFAHVAPVCRPDAVRSACSTSCARRRAARSRRGARSPPRRSRRPRPTTRRSPRWFGETDLFPDAVTLSFEKVADLAYGENPHQRAAYYAEDGTRRHLLSRSSQLGGRSSRTTTSPTSRARAGSLREFTLPAAVIVKHGEPVRRRASRPRSRRPTSGRSRPTRSRRSAACSSSTGRSPAPRRADRGALRRGAARARVRRRGARGAAGEAGAAPPLRPRAPDGDAGRARLQARARRPARPGARRRRRRPRS